MFRLEREQIPEKLDGFTGVCLVLTLESMFSSILGCEVAAPMSVLKSREGYVNFIRRKMGYERERALNITNLWGAINTRRLEKEIDNAFWRLLRLDERELFVTILPK